MAMWSWSFAVQQSLARIGTLFHSNLDLEQLNIGAFKSDKVDSIVEELNAAPDLQKRIEAGKKLAVAATDELP